MKSIEDVLKLDYVSGDGKKLIVEINEVTSTNLSEMPCLMCNKDIYSGNEKLVSKCDNVNIKAIELKCLHCHQKYHITEKINIPSLLK